MTRLRLTIAADGREAVAAATAGPPLGADEVAAALAAAGIVHGIDAAALAAFAAAAATGAAVPAMPLARATPPVPGADARLDLRTPAGPIAGTAQPDGHLDYRERHLLQPVRAGEVLGAVVPATAGQPGADVRGRPLPAPPGQPLRLRLGPGVRRDGERLLAARDGALCHKGAELDVLPLYVHAGDVDYRAGNLHSDGSVHVRGDVTEGFAVHATGDLVVDGAVRSATLDAGGSVAVGQGVLGDRSEVRAGRDLACRHATSARLHAGGTLRVRDQATHCALRGAAVLVQGGRGAVVGGRVLAETRVEVTSAGTAQGAATLLGIGLPGEAARRLAEAAAAADRDERAAGRAGGGKALRRAVRSADAVQQELLQLRRAEGERLAAARIVVHEHAHPGVRVQFGDRTLQLDAALRAVAFRFDPRQDRIVFEACR